MRNLARALALAVIGGLVTLVPIQPAFAQVDSLEVTPETAVRILGSSQTFTATVTVTPPETLAGHNIVFDDDDNGLTPAPAECLTSATGSCTVTFESVAGKITLRAYVEDGGTLLPCPAPVNADADCAELRDEAAPGGAGDVPEPDDTDVVEVEGLEGSLQVTDEEDAAAPNGTAELTATLMSTETTPRGLLGNVDAEILGGSPNADLFPGEADTDCDTTQAGTCPLTYPTGATAPGVDTVQSWADLNDDPAAGTGNETAGDLFEADASEGPDENAQPGDVDEDPPDRTDVVHVNISAPPELVLDVEPETTSSKPTGTQSALTAKVTSGAAPQSGIVIAAAVDAGGANVGTAIPTCTTGANGQCTLNYTGNAEGTDTVRAVVDENANGLNDDADPTEAVNQSTTPGGTVEPDKTDVVSIIWKKPTPPPPPPEEDTAACDQAKKQVKKAKKALKKAKATGDEEKIKKAKKRLKKAKKRKRAACA